MSLIFFGIYSSDFIVFYVTITENHSHSGFVNVVDAVDPYVLKKVIKTQVLLMLLMLLIFGEAIPAERTMHICKNRFPKRLTTLTTLTEPGFLTHFCLHKD